MLARDHDATTRVRAKIARDPAEPGRTNISAVERRLKRTRHASNVARSHGEAMVSGCARGVKSRLDRMGPVHRVRRLRQTPLVRELSSVAKMKWAARQKIRIERDDDVGGGDIVVRDQRVRAALADQRRIHIYA